MSEYNDFFEKIAEYKSTYNYPADLAKHVKPPFKPTDYGTVALDTAMGLTSGAVLGHFMGTPLANLAKKITSNPQATTAARAVGIAAGAGLCGKFMYDEGKSRDKAYATYEKDPEGYKKRLTDEFNKEYLPLFREEEEAYANNIIRHPYAPKGLTAEVAAKKYREASPATRYDMEDDDRLRWLYENDGPGNLNEYKDGERTKLHGLESLYNTKIAEYTSNYAYPDVLAKRLEKPKKPSIGGAVTVGTAIGGMGAAMGGLVATPVAGVADMFARTGSKVPRNIVLGGMGLGATLGLYAGVDHYRNGKRDLKLYEEHPEQFKARETASFRKWELPNLQGNEEYYANNVGSHPRAPKGLTPEIAAKMYRANQSESKDEMLNDAWIGEMHKTNEDVSDFEGYYKGNPDYKLTGLEHLYNQKTAGIANFGRKVISNLKGRKADLAKLDSVIATNTSRANFGADGAAKAKTNIDFLRRQSDMLRKKPASIDDLLTTANKLSEQEKVMQGRFSDFNRYADVENKARLKVLNATHSKSDIEDAVLKTRVGTGIVAGTGLVGAGAYAATRNEKTAGMWSNYVSNLKGRKDDIANADIEMQSAKQRMHDNMEAAKVRASAATDDYRNWGQRFSMLDSDYKNGIIKHDEYLSRGNQLNEEYRKADFDHLTSLNNDLDTFEADKKNYADAARKGLHINSQVNSARNLTAAGVALAIPAALYGGTRLALMAKHASSAEDEYVQYIMKHPNIPKGYTPEKARADYQKANSDQRYQMEDMAYEAYETDGKSPSKLQFPKIAALAGEAVKAVTKSPIAKGVKDATINAAANAGFSGYEANRKQNERPGNIQLAGDK